jgi:hypothetical protein
MTAGPQTDRRNSPLARIMGEPPAATADLAADLLQLACPGLAAGRPLPKPRARGLGRSAPEGVRDGGAKHMPSLRSEREMRERREMRVVRRVFILSRFSSFLACLAEGSACVLARLCVFAEQTSLPRLEGRPSPRPSDGVSCIMRVSVPSCNYPDRINFAEPYLRRCDGQNSKHEIRSPKQAQNSNFQMFQTSFEF